MGVHEGRARLGKVVRELINHWGDLRIQWDDASSRAFEVKYMAPIEEDAKMAVGAMDQMSHALAQMRRDCD